MGHYQEQLSPAQNSSLTTNRSSGGASAGSMAFSKPVPAQTLSPITPINPTNQVHAIHDLLVWYEIFELSPNGEYAAATVDHSDDVPCSGRFILHQGIQRRIGITLCHESGSELIWKDVQEVVVGRIRGQRDSVFDESDGQVLSLNIISSHYIQKQHDERTFYHFEVAWDSSLHNSLLLNRCTSSGNSVYLTISSYLEIENSFQPAIITKDLCLVLYPRGGDSTSRIRSSLKNFFLSTNSPILNLTDYSNRVSAVYELKLRRATSMNIHSQDSSIVNSRQRKVIDTSKIYVRGEEMLEGWRPRSDSLIIEHQQDLEKLYKIECVEYTKHFLQVKNRLENPLLSPNDNSPEKIKYSLNSIDPSKPIDHRQENLLRRCVSMMLPPPPIVSKLTVPEIEVTTDRLSSDDFGTVHSLLKSTSTYSFTNLNTANMINSFIKASCSSSDLSKFAHLDPSYSISSLHQMGGSISPNIPKSRSMESLMNTSSIALKYIPSIEEVRISPVVSRRGYLNFLEEKGTGWVKKFVVVRRPFAFIYNHEKDPVERALINLGTARIEFNDEDIANGTRSARNTFSVVSKYRGFLIQPLAEKDVHDWLYAFNPLLAGQIKSRLSGRAKVPID